MSQHWTDSQTSRLIQFYERNPHLWNKKVADQATRSRVDTIHEIAQRLNKTEKEITAKWHKLTFSYQRIKKRIQKKQTTTPGAVESEDDAAKNENWVHWLEMQFLKTLETNESRTFTPFVNRTSFDGTPMMTTTTTTTTATDANGINQSHHQPSLMLVVGGSAVGGGFGDKKFVDHQMQDLMNFTGPERIVRGVEEEETDEEGAEQVEDPVMINNGHSWSENHRNISGKSDKKRTENSWKNEETEEKVFLNGLAPSLRRLKGTFLEKAKMEIYQVIYRIYQEQLNSTN